MASRVFGCVLMMATGMLSLPGRAQVLPLEKIQDPAARTLQRQHIAQLQQVAADAAALHFPYPFYFSQTLDIDEAKQKQLPLGSIHFEQFNGQTVLQITGNYYISYAAAKLNGNQRARKSYEDVILPLLKIAVARMDRTVPFAAYAFEISHHVRSKALKVSTEGAENLMMLFPRTVAERLAAAKDVETQQQALLESAIYLNGDPLTLWLSGDDAPADVRDHYLARRNADSSSSSSSSTSSSSTSRPTLVAENAEPGTLVNPRYIPESELLNKIRGNKTVARDTSPVALEKLKTAYDATLQSMIPTLKAQAHFVDYAPPDFIAFHEGAYLQLNVTTDLEQPGGPSQYRIAALAFDTHISHLLRPVSKYFHDNPKFEGVDFSTTVHQPGQSASQSVEFVVPFGALLCYEKYDCTGQELINRSIVLINGERVSLDLQRAEADPGTGTR
ncbi:MAG TPA: hypothetical protein VF532_00455 [Candidatus Angelobacter sp.]